MRVVETPFELIQIRSTWKDKTVGFVPTMGALHEGHKTLLNQAGNENEIVILSIYVNPTQFNNPEDFKNYPSTWDKDVEIARESGVDILFAPNYQEMYPDAYRYLVHEKELSTQLCGEHRPGHFDGVLSIILKLFNLVQPTKAYFGEKDYQQLSLIQGLVQAFFIPVEIVPVQTVREKDGLALSSRNLRLSFEERAKAPELHKIVTSAKSAEEAKMKLAEAGFKVDYVTDLDERRFVAAYLGPVRLIDNVEV